MTAIVRAGLLFAVLLLACGPTAAAPDAGDAIDSAQSLTLTSTLGVFSQGCPGGPTLSFWQVDFTIDELNFEACECPGTGACRSSRGQRTLSAAELEQVRAAVRAITVPQTPECVTDGPTVRLDVVIPDGGLHFHDLPREGPACRVEPGASQTRDLHTVRTVLSQLGALP